MNGVLTYPVLERMPTLRGAASGSRNYMDSCKLELAKFNFDLTH
jgi:hypothetical protein